MNLVIETQRQASVMLKMSEKVLEFSEMSEKTSTSEKISEMSEKTLKAISGGNSAF